jgi:hypothetical protein
VKCRSELGVAAQKIMHFERQASIQSEVELEKSKFSAAAENLRQRVQEAEKANNRYLF